MLPSCWNEINRRNLLFLSKRFPYQPTRGLSLSFFWHALNLPANPKLAWAIAQNFILSKKMNLAWKNDAVMEFGETNFWEQQIIMALEELDNFQWLHTDGAIEQCLIKKFRIGFTYYYGPDERLCNVTATEFEHADMFLLEFLTSKEEHLLNKCIATLWRESKWFNKSDDIRVPFSEFSLEKREKKIARMPQYLKNACLINYLGMRKAFIESSNAAVVFSESKTQKASKSTNWGTILLRLAEKQVFGTYKQTRESYIHDIVDYMADLKIQEQERAKNVS